MTTKNANNPKILHIAPLNLAGVPITLVNAERKLGFYSRLITFARHPHGYEEDICLNLPLINFPLLQFIKRIVSEKSKSHVTNIATISSEIPKKWIAHNRIESLLIKLREIIWHKKISETIKKYKIDQFDVVQLDGGLGFYRDGRIIQALKAQGKKIVCCYTGSDLRTRGVIPEIDKISDLNVSVEFDHLKLHPRIQHVFFPFDHTKFKIKIQSAKSPIIIGHAPTNRLAKGSDKIIPIVRELEKKYPLKLILIENLSYLKALELKSQCHIFIDQIGDLGYGINSLESLAMGIVTCSCLAPGFEQIYPDHPFIVIDENNLKEKLIYLIENEEFRIDKGIYGRKWVEKYHDSEKIVLKIHHLAGF